MTSLTHLKNTLPSSWGDNPFLYEDDSLRLLYAPHALSETNAMLIPNYTLHNRLVTTPDEFFEKIRIFHDGYHDAFIEWVKLVLIHQDDTLHVPLTYKDHQLIDAQGQAHQLNLDLYHSLYESYYREMQRLLLAHGFFKVDTDFIYHFMLHESNAIHSLTIDQIPAHALADESFYIETVSPLTENDFTEEATGFLGYGFFDDSQSLAFHCLGIMRKQEGRYYMLTTDFEHHNVIIPHSALNDAHFDIIYADANYSHIIDHYRQQREEPPLFHLIPFYQGDEDSSTL